MLGELKRTQMEYDNETNVLFADNNYDGRNKGIYFVLFCLCLRNKLCFDNLHHSLIKLN